MLELPADLEGKLLSEAARFNLSLPDYILQLLATTRPSGAPPQNGADLVAYWESEGLIGTRPDIEDSVSHARALRERAQRRG